MVQQKRSRHLHGTPGTACHRSGAPPKRTQGAERVGFEPTVAQGTTTVFETVPFNHSGTSPSLAHLHALRQVRAGLYPKRKLKVGH